jgi:TPR repeat protein
MIKPIIILTSLLFSSVTTALEFNFDEPYQKCFKVELLESEATLKNCLLDHYDSAKVEYFLAKANFSIWNNVERAKELLISALLKGQEDALVYYGILLYRGQYFEQDKGLAIKALNKAYDKQSLWAAQTLGLIYLYNKQPPLAEKYLLEAYKKERLVSGMFLGMLSTVRDDFDQAYEYYASSFIEGNLLAYVLLVNSILQKSSTCYLLKPPFSKVMPELNAGLENEIHLLITSRILDQFQATLNLSDAQLLQQVPSNEYIRKLVEDLNMALNKQSYSECN